MKFYARLTPGILRDMREPLELVLHQPQQATSGLVVKIFEKASYTDVDGRFVEEGGEDDLLLELHGSVASDPVFRKRGRAKFSVEKAVAPTRDTKAPLGVLRVRVEGAPEVHEAPIPSTEAELGGQNFEISLTIEHGGAEVFRSRVTTFIRPALANPRVHAKRLLGFDAGGAPIYDEEDDDVSLAGRYATIGTSSSPNDDGQLVILGIALIGHDGRLAPCAEDGTPKDGELLLLRTHRDLFAYVTREIPTVSKTLGPSKISIRLCHPIEVDGSLRIDVPDTTHVYDFDVHMPGEAP